MLPYQTSIRQDDRIVIVGIGGAGANILQCFGGSSAANVRLCTMSLDERVGQNSGNVEFLQLGAGLNHGLGSGGDPEVGRRATAESEGEIRRLIRGARLLVMVVGLGGGTGSGAAPMLARLAKDEGLFLVTVAVMPFAFEGRRRRAQADAALEDVSQLSDIVYCFENDYMEDLFRGRSGARAVFEEVNRLLAKATASVPMLASSPGLINLGLDELATALENSDSRCLFGSGSGYGANRAESAARAALQSPLLAFHNAIRYSRCVIAHVAGGDNMSLTEVRTAMETVRQALADDDVTLYFGTSVKPHLGDEMRMTLIASINGEELRQAIENPPVPAPDREPADGGAASDGDEENGGIGEAGEGTAEAADTSSDTATDVKPRGTEPRDTARTEGSGRPADSAGPARTSAPTAQAQATAREALSAHATPSHGAAPRDRAPQGEPARSPQEEPSLHRGEPLLEPEEPEYSDALDERAREPWHVIDDGEAPERFPRPAAAPSVLDDGPADEVPESLFDVGSDSAPRFSREAAERRRPLSVPEPPLSGERLNDRHDDRLNRGMNERSGDRSEGRLGERIGERLSERPAGPSASLRQGELMSESEPHDDAPPPTQGRRLFRDGHPRESAEGRGLDSDDLDIPPALRFNNLNTFFPDN